MQNWRSNSTDVVICRVCRDGFEGHFRDRNNMRLKDVKLFLKILSLLRTYL